MTSLDGQDLSGRDQDGFVVDDGGSSKVRAGADVLANKRRAGEEVSSMSNESEDATKREGKQRTSRTRAVAMKVGTSVRAELKSKLKKEVENAVNFEQRRERTRERSDLRARLSDGSLSEVGDGSLESSDVGSLVLADNGELGR